MEGEQVRAGRDRVLGRVVGGDAGVAQDAARGLHAGAADPARHHGGQRGAPQAEPPDHARHRARGVLAGGDGGGRVQHQRHVDARVLEHDRERLLVALAGRVADQVHRVRARPGGRQHRVELRDRGRRELREPRATCDQRVGGEHGEAAAVRQDRGAVAAQARRAHQRLGGVEQLVDALDAQHAGAAQGGVEHVVGAGQRAGVGERRLRGLRVAARLQHQHRLVARGRARRGQELARRARRAAAAREALQVQQDRARVGVGAEPVEQIGHVDVGRVADRGEAGEADARPARPVEHRGADRARLGQERELAGPGVDVREARVEPDAGHDEAQAVGPEHAEAAPPGRLVERLEQRLATRVAALGKARSQHHRGARAGVGQGAHDLGHRGRRRADHGQVRHQRQRLRVRVREHARHRLVARVHRHHRPAKAPAQQVAHHHRAHPPGPVRGAEHGDAARPQQDVEVAHAHRPGG